MILEAEAESPTQRTQCIVCGTYWGVGEYNGSHGICINCFAEWAIIRRPCFGDIKNCSDEQCTLKKYCIEYYNEILKGTD